MSLNVMNETHLHLGRGVCGNFEQAVEREWLVTNGMGGYASGTVGDLNTRRYHGLLMAALTPPAGRTLLVAKMDVTVRYGGKTYPLFCNEFVDGTVTPHGYLHLETFFMDGTVPVWHYALADALIEKRVLMAPGQNTTYLHFRILRASDTLELELKPLCTYRDYHSHSHGDWDMHISEIRNGFKAHASQSARSYRIICNGAKFIADPAWYWNFKHRVETVRGMDDSEDLFCPGRFTLTLDEGRDTTCVMSAESTAPKKFAVISAQIHESSQALLAVLPADAPHWIRQLALATEQFIVDRYHDGRPTGKTLIAGYPWFGDWGRDTMIALPGLTLALKRFDMAASILRTFAAHINEGMLPNRFPDHGEMPEYNTVDATLWYFNAVDQYTRRSGDITLAKALYPVLVDIIAYHRKGTRYGIKVDVRDGLLAAGEEGTQLTWMDAKIGDWVVTPRIGKAVEVNALWYNALAIMADLSKQLGRKKLAGEYCKATAQVRSSFQRFWNDEQSYLYDVIDGPEGVSDSDERKLDSRLRPNQIFAVSLPNSPLNKKQQKAVVDVCARELLTSNGLRSLAPDQHGYVPYYRGNPLQRDAAYHQGTVWAWLIGPFVDAHYRVYRDADKARSFLEPLGLHLGEACVGSVSEIFDAESPFAPRGCFAQAWSVSEVLRAWLDLNDGAHNRLMNTSIGKGKSR
ncbi:amylo-alpha-1,6-glucosidase [Candidatus Nitrotoga sp. M5]|uniref:amylo-alpha-1,6-glucosidase n=1 Tax=Candidatus Nitrotoga sp. M5 TaxID=2890409 RepID=UPI001EF24F42|nr:amylo-alpha-1,6-glucosidase [Candidatus Nitrotoga sp. M5]